MDDKGQRFARATVELTAHATTPDTVVRNLTARIARTKSTLSITYVLEGELARLRIPEPAAPKMDWTLWRHTCFEVFLAADGSPGYREFNFSPSGEWGAFAFQRYREGGPVEDAALAPGISVRRGAGRLALQATVPLDRLPPPHGEAPLRIGLTAVVESNDGSLSYWALRHAAERPDFHHPESFALRLDGPPREAGRRR